MNHLCVPLLFLGLATVSACAPHSTAIHAHEDGLKESPSVHIPYESPAAALAALRVKTGVVTEEKEEWFILNDKAENSLWSITKPGHFAHPTAVLRRTYEHEGQVFIGMDVKCSNSKENCDRVVQQFLDLNNKIRDQFKKQ